MMDDKDLFDDISDYLKTQQSIPYREYNGTAAEENYHKGPDRFTLHAQSTPVVPVPRMTPWWSKKRIFVGVSIILICVLFVAVVGYDVFVVSGTADGAFPDVPSVQTGPVSFHYGPCPFTPGKGMVEGQQVRCGMLQVPEDRNQTAGNKVKLAVAIYKGDGGKQATPFVYLEGGPGGSALDNFGQYISSDTIDEITQVTKGHDIILFDQRGTGYSEPSLDCRLEQSGSGGSQTMVQVVQRCHNRLVSSGVHLASYTTIDSATDVHDLIHALGYKQIDMYGVSYGTRLAQTVMRMYPGDIRSVVLDSTVPTQSNMFLDAPVVQQHAYDTLFTGCILNMHCFSSHPGLETTFDQLVPRLNSAPMKVHDEVLGETDMSGDDFVDWMYRAMYDQQIIPELPAIIDQVDNGDDTLLSKVYGKILDDRGMFSDGFYYSVECGEDMDFTTTAALEDASKAAQEAIRHSISSELKSIAQVCQEWHQPTVPAVQKQPVNSAVPTLILSGEYDPITPPSYARLVQATLSKGYMFEFPGTTHGVFLLGSCPDSIMLAFLQNPQHVPASSCIASMKEPYFQ